ncbi:hypothetical protein JWG88_20835 [Desulfopila inferna]|nr:hypothetical protein [Desulfopila inferna]
MAQFFKELLIFRLVKIYFLAAIDQIGSYWCVCISIGVGDEHEETKYKKN